jgi:hypothetical protein
MSSEVKGVEQLKQENKALRMELQSMQIIEGERQIAENESAYAAGFEQRPRLAPPQSAPSGDMIY